jgi:hypothetical protein
VPTTHPCSPTFCMPCCCLSSAATAATTSTAGSKGCLLSQLFCSEQKKNIFKIYYHLQTVLCPVHHTVAHNELTSATQWQAFTLVAWAKVVLLTESLFCYQSS